MSQLRTFTAFLEKNKAYKLQNKHPDVFQVLKDDPKVKELTEKREVAMNELSGRNEKTKEFDDTLKRIEELDVQIEALTKQFIKRGIVPKALGEEYVRENTRMGW